MARWVDGKMARLLRVLSTANLNCLEGLGRYAGGKKRGGMCVYQKDIYVSSPVISIGPLDLSRDSVFFFFSAWMSS